jgi:4-diphosphocytidyl-2-C-methyl-D-erythritol kinase
MMDSLEVESPGKVNLGLSVVGKRSDGYHDIETLFTTIGLKDLITVRRKTSGLDVTADGRDAPEGEGNLVYTALKKMFERAGCSGGVEVAISKSIPAGAGLGGGSSNAAAAIKAANELLDLGMADEALCAVARDVGSDVPFFLKGGAAVAKGRGDELDFFDPGMKLDMVIVYPGFPVSTSWAYSRVDSGLTPEWFDIKILASALQHGDLSSLCEGLYNSFEDVVFNAHPLLSEIKNEMMESGALGSLLSGSGSSIFAIAPDRKVGSRLRGRLSRDDISVWQTTSC